MKLASMLRRLRNTQGGGARSAARSRSTPYTPYTNGPFGPVAHAGSDQTVSVKTKVYFDGSGSTDPDGGNLYYSWAFGAGAKPATGRGVKPSCTYTTTGDKTVTLTVRDTDNNVASDTVDITVIELTLKGPATVTRGEEATYTATVKPDELEPTFTWEFTAMIENDSVPIKRDPEKTTENDWGGIMVNNGVLQVEAHIKGKTFTESLEVNVENRNWITDVPWEKCTRSWGRPKPCGNGDLGLITFGALYPRYDPNTVDSGPNKGLTYLVLPTPGTPGTYETPGTPETPETPEGKCIPTYPPSLENPENPSAPVAVSAPAKVCINRHFYMSEDDLPQSWRAFRDAQVGIEAVEGDGQVQYDEIVGGVEKHEGSPTSPDTERNHYRQWHDIITKANPAIAIENIVSKHGALGIKTIVDVVIPGLSLGPRLEMRALNWKPTGAITDQHPSTYLEGDIQFPASQDDDCQERGRVDQY